MSVLIRGMKMPKDCRECLMKAYYSSGKTWCKPVDRLLADDYKPIIYGGRPDWCPLVELPEKHGDLIDRDALVPDICHDWNGYTVPDDDYSRKCIENAPVLIEAEGE